VLEKMQVNVVILLEQLKKQRNTPTEYPVFGLRFGAGTSEIPNRLATHLTATFNTE
jgi:hypothetical protein